MLHNLAGSYAALYPDKTVDMNTLYDDMMRDLRARENKKINNGIIDPLSFFQISEILNPMSPAQYLLNH
ncbi:MAG: hypothetical protein H6621_05480 [Halobacteriovoraceae bacterium]|nr:hypothetical protein [Halobacteriovoraceae bacterium]